MRWGFYSVFICFSSLVFAQNHSTSKSYQPTEERVVYGEDNRLDLYELTDLQWKARATSTVALIRDKLIEKESAGSNYKIHARVYGDSKLLCKDEPFYEQSYASFCSGSLIAPDIVMTAGHCVKSFKACESVKFVFNYSYLTKNADPTVVAANNLYSCKELIYSQAANADFALVRLDRKVVGRKPLALNTSSVIKVGDKLVLIGNPSGIPTKVAAGATVLKTTHKDYFVTDTDSYAGNSGSAVFNEKTGLIEGILVRGHTDFKNVNGCFKSVVCKGLQDCRGEDVTRMSSVLPYLPED